jgi:peptidoglycan/LPS O-acetylase OafA/YrhL
MTKLSLINLLLFIVIGVGLFLVNDHYIFLEELKNPPSIYYFSYSLFISSILWIYSRKIENTLGKLKLKSSILFIAQNSLWIYFWHIPIINIFLKLPDVNFVLEYLVVFSVSALITYCQIWIVNNVVIKHISNTNLSKNIKALLTG